MTDYAIVWVDRDGDPHLRLLRGTAADLARAKELLGEIYDDFPGEPQEFADAAFASLGAIEDELRAKRM